MGRSISTESETSEVMVLYGEHVERLIAKNDQPLSAKDAAKVEEKINKFMAERKNETEEQRKKRLADEQKIRGAGEIVRFGDCRRLQLHHRRRRES